MEQFLNSKSMITPGVAGAVVTVIVATLSSQFGLPAKWIALVTSVLIALLIFFADQAGKILVRLIILVLNTAIIFSVSVGTNATATAATKPKAQVEQPQFESAPEPTPTPFFHDWF
jgi:hypothetical protein